MKTQNRLQFPAILLAVFLVLIVTSCEVEKEENKPVVATNEVTAIKSTEALCGGTITSDGGFTITSRGVCWSTEQNPTIDDNKTTGGTGAGSFTSQMTDLQPKTNYYVRAYAKNSAGTGYGNAMSFTTTEEVTDADGNVYSAVVIGHQEWFAENLKTTKYNNGTPIPNVTVATEWSQLTTGACCSYDNNINNVGTYGLLYNWRAVNSGKLCPAGWHVPTETEWAVLTDYLGGADKAGGKLKETGTRHWNSPNAGATNATGFTAIPGGYRLHNSSEMGKCGRWWSATEYSSDFAWYQTLCNSNYSIVSGTIEKTLGFSVRCVKD